MTNTLRCVIADDEPLTRHQLLRHLETAPDVEVVAQCRDGEGAAAAIEQSRPDVAFLNVDMLRISDFDVISAVGSDRMPHVVFVSDHEQQVVRAFQMNGLSYLTKPIDRGRVHEVLSSARAELHNEARRDTGRKLHAVMQALRKDFRMDRLVIKTRGRLIFVHTEDIDWIEAAGNYVKLNVGKESYFVRGPLTQIARRLDHDNFCRIHRGCIVNMERVQESYPWFNGDWIVVLTNGTKLTVSRGHRAHLKRWMAGAV